MFTPRPMRCLQASPARLRRARSVVKFTAGAGAAILLQGFSCREATAAALRDCRSPAPWTCEPEGLRVLSDFGFDAPSGGGWSAQKKYGIVRTIRDDSAPLSPPNVL